MNITLTGTKITQDNKFLAFEKNNGVDVINITVDTDESWTYKLDVKYPEKCCSGKQMYNIINLSRTDNTCTTVLTKDMLSFTGKYIMQLRGISGDKVCHSDTFDCWVKYSIEPASTYDPVPSEFYQIEQNVTEMNNHPPKPGENGYWLIWDITTSQYKESDIPLPDGTLPEVTADTSGKYLSNDGKKAYWAEVQTGTESKIDKIEVNGVEQPIVDKTVNIAVPTKTSDLSNDSGYITNEALDGYATKAELPTKVSQLENDSKFINESALDGYAKTADIPTKTSQLNNDSGYITANDVPVKSVDGATGDVVTNAVKTTTQTLTDAQKQQARTNIGAGTSSFDGDYNSLTNKPTIPTKTSQLTNDSGFITDAALIGYAKTTDIPTKTSQLENDSNYITANEAPVTSVNSKTGAVQLNASDVGALPDTTVIPSKTSQLDNDSGFITSAPVASVNTKTGAVTLSASDVGAQSTITASGILKGDGAGGVTAATPGTDYADVFIIDCTADGTDDGSKPITVTPSKTYDEVRNAILGQKQCYAQYAGIYYPLAEVFINAAESNNIEGAIFTVAKPGIIMRSIRMQHLTLDEDPVWRIEPPESTLRAPASATKGQVMAYRGGLRGWMNSDIGTNLSTAFSGLIKGSDGYLAQAEAGTDYMAPVAVTSADNGKFMRVVNGMWVAAEGDASFDITGASTGQSPIINAVDADGKPTAWGTALLVKVDGSNIPINAKDDFRTNVGALPGVKVYGKADANGKIMAYIDAACTEEVGNADVLGLVEYGNALLIYDHKTYQCVGFEEPASMQGSGYYLVAVFFRSEIATDSASAVLKVETAKLNIMDYMAGMINAPIIITTGELSLTTITTT